MLTQQRQVVRYDLHSGFLPPLFLFYAATGIVCFGSALFAPWFNWGFLVCAMFGVAGIVLVLKRNKAIVEREANVYGEPQAFLAKSWHVFMPLLATVSTAGYCMLSVCYDYLFG